jgi:hypothetical protein
MPAQTLEEAAEQAGLGPLPPALRNRRDIVPAAPPPHAPITDMAAALARYRRWGPEAEPVAVLRQHVEQRTVERHWLALDLADASLPRPAGWARNPLPFNRNLPALPLENLDIDVVLAAVDQLDLAALEILVQVPGGAELLAGESRDPLFQGAMALGLARLSRWSLGWLRVCYALEPERAAPHLLEVLLDAASWQAAIDFLDRHDDPALRAYAACRIPPRVRARAGRDAWLPATTDPIGSASASPSPPTRAQAAQQIGALGAALTNQQPLPAVDPLALVQPFPPWVEPLRLVVLSAARAGAPPDHLVALHQQFRAQFGVDRELCRRLGQLTTDEAREALARDVAAVVLHNPHCARAWDSLCLLGARDDFALVDFALTHF